MMHQFNTTHILQRELTFRRQIRNIFYNFINNLILFFFILLTAIIYVFIGYMMYKLCITSYLLVFAYQKDCYTCIRHMQKYNQENFKSNIISSYIY